MIGSERAGKAVRVCAVALTAGTALLPAAAAHAAPVAEYEYNFRDVFTGAYRQTIPFEANVSTTSVAGAGETVNFRFSLRADQWQPGWLYPLDAFKLRVDLSHVADDVLDIEDVLDTLEATPMNGLTMEVVGNTVEFYGEFDEGAPRQFEVKFSVDVAPGGDGLLGVPASFETRGTDDFNSERWDYAPAGGATLPVVVAHPAPLVTKDVDRLLVLQSAPDVKYTITVKRPEGAEVPEYFSVEEDLTDVIQEAGGLMPDEFVLEQGRGDLEVVGNKLVGSGFYDQNGEWVLSFITSHLGLGDAVLTNTVCVQSPERTTTAQKDPNTPVTGIPGAPNVVQLAVPGGSACAEAPEVEIIHAPGKPVEPDTEDPEVVIPPKEPEVVPESPQPGTSAEQLAATGSQPLGIATMLGSLIAATGAVFVSAAVYVRRARQKQ
ncbi:hypothetical protein ICM05_09960 [Leucobacter sp. cx-42]|uniref:hypothetical protein n=1 Tax=unclassified Leucobacter TaxID=2621730 RepID=UPI00165DD60B|nr:MULTISPECIES: hypothetical protein [unclassified Leucobacter]MBC9954962.1 hypothetical protein [Leucobacter sp. cx-42]